MRPQVTRIQVGRDILILGDAETLRGLPHGLRRRSAVCGVLRRMATDAHAMRQLRQYWASRSLSQPNGLRSDRELLEVVEAAVERGAVPALVIPDHGPHVRDLQLIEPGTTAARALVSRPVSQMTAEERLWEVVTRAAAKLPRATGEALLGLFTPENLAIAAGLAALSAAANLTPVGWAADAVMLAVAVGFGGLAAIQGLKDLTACFYLTANATTQRDLDEAATHLAKVIADFGVMWLMALLHERAKRGAGGGEGEQLDRSSVDARKTSPARARAGPTLTEEVPVYAREASASSTGSSANAEVMSGEGPPEEVKGAVEYIESDRGATTTAKPGRNEPNEAVTKPTIENEVSATTSESGNGSSISAEANEGEPAGEEPEQPPGSFSIWDWSGYPEGVPRPEGPFRMLEGPEYQAARKAANNENRAIRKREGLVGQDVDVHEDQPVKFGGSPTDLDNKTVLPRDVHRKQVTPWWNKLQKDIGY